MMTLALGSIAWGVQMPQTIQAAATARNTPVVKNIEAPNTAARYEAMAKQFRQEAQNNRELASAQEPMARNVEVASK